MKRKPKGSVRSGATSAEPPAQSDVAVTEGEGPASEDAPRAELPTRRQLRLQQVAGKAVSPDVDQPARDVKKQPLPGGRRDRRLQYTASMTALQGTGTVPARMPEPSHTTGGDGGMAIEEALAERKALDSAARTHFDEVAAGGSDDPFAVDPAMLARQQALAQRAAALNARNRQEQSVQPVQVPAALQDPTAPHNLSFLVPLQVMRVAGSNQLVLRGPATSLIPVVIPSAALPGAVGAGSQPIGARSAFGLDPLDAMTAGLRRLRRVRYLQYSMFGVGAAALATGIIMIVSSLNG